MGIDQSMLTLTKEPFIGYMPADICALISGEISKENWLWFLCVFLIRRAACSANWMKVMNGYVMPSMRGMKSTNN